MEKFADNTDNYYFFSGIQISTVDKNTYTQKNMATFTSHHIKIFNYHVSAVSITAEYLFFKV